MMMKGSQVFRVVFTVMDPSTCARSEAVYILLFMLWTLVVLHGLLTSSFQSPCSGVIAHKPYP